MRSIDLAEGKPEDFRDFVVAVVGLAAEDERKGKPGRTGTEIVSLLTEGSRRMHRRLASTVYNQVRESMRLAEEDKG